MATRLKKWPKPLYKEQSKPAPTKGEETTPEAADKPAPKKKYTFLKAKE